jgi:hypothetical protein
MLARKLLLLLLLLLFLFFLLIIFNLKIIVFFCFVFFLPLQIHKLYFIKGIIGILGPFPEHVLRSGKETSSFFTLGNIVYDRIGPHSTSGPGSGNGQKKFGWDRQK